MGKCHIWVLSWGELNCIHTKISDLDLPLWLPSGLWSYCGTENIDIAACHLAFRHSHLDLYAACSSFIKNTTIYVVLHVIGI